MFKSSEDIKLHIVFALKSNYSGLRGSSFGKPIFKVFPFGLAVRQLGVFACMSVSVSKEVDWVTRKYRGE